MNNFKRGYIIKWNNHVNLYEFIKEINDNTLFLTFLDIQANEKIEKCYDINDSFLLSYKILVTDIFEDIHE